MKTAMRALRYPRWLLLMGLLVGASCKRVEGPAAVSREPPEIVTTADGIEMVRLPAGRFTMGSDRGEKDRSPAHEVEIDEFLIDCYETRQKHYIALMLDNGSKFKGDDRPAEMISWVDAAMYCNARSEAEGLQPCYNEDTTCNYDADGYRLPTEAEWEYACRAGNQADYSFGSDPRLLKDQGWFKENAAKTTHPVGKKKPNAWGLYDMHGNVAEWCNDKYDKTYYQKSPPKNPHGPQEGEKYLLRGGSWASSAEACQSAARAADTPGFTDACFPRETLGFRCVRRAPAKSDKRADRGSTTRNVVEEPEASADDPGTSGASPQETATSSTSATAHDEASDDSAKSDKATTGFLHGDISLRHKTGSDHPERPERLNAIVERLKEKGLLDKLAAVAFKPYFVLISAGFDAHEDDPLGGMKVTAEGFAGLTRIVNAIADQCCKGRLVSILEGGYDLDGLAESVEAHIRVLMHKPTDDQLATQRPSTHQELRPANERPDEITPCCFTPGRSPSSF